MIDRTNQEWMEALRDPISSEALEDLRIILVRGLKASLSSRVKGDLDSLVEDFAQDALMKVLKSLETFRGESRFTTWAQKIAIHVAFTELRRRRWKDISLQDIIETDDGSEYTPKILTDPTATPEQKTTQRSILEMVQTLIDEELTDRQRDAMLAVLQGGMPLSEVAKHLGTNRNALYKLIFDARQRLQRRLYETSNLTAQDVLAIFEDKQV
ncbi:MAG: sigma-70 family RNA polymerase sigma factor [Anaerolineales bacterium]|nr:sigma-70 family RNA polymerase sigma factor [Anaerolineales bacterium]